MDRKQRNLFIRRIGALFFVLMFAFASLLTSRTPTTDTTAVPTTGPQTTAQVVFPTVRPGGTSVVADYTYIHTSGVLALPHLVGWDPAQGPNQSPEERVEPFGTPGTPGSSQITRIGVTFING